MVNINKPFKSSQLSGHKWRYVCVDNLQEQILYFKQELDNSRNKYYELEKAKNKEIEELQIKNSQLEIQLRERVKSLEIQIEFLNNELRRVKELLEKKVLLFLLYKDSRM